MWTKKVEANTFPPTATIRVHRTRLLKYWRTREVQPPSWTGKNTKTDCWHSRLRLITLNRPVFLRSFALGSGKYYLTVWNCFSRSKPTNTMRQQRIHLTTEWFLYRKGKCVFVQPSAERRHEQYIASAFFSFCHEEKRSILSKNIITTNITSLCNIMSRICRVKRSDSNFGLSREQ